MADVTITYKGATIAEMNATDSKTLRTSETYCEDDITVSYTPNKRTYEITLSKAAGWVLLTTLDDDVLTHINDASLTVVLQYMGTEFVTYGMTLVTVSNTSKGQQGNYPVYGVSLRQSTSTSTNPQQCYYPANNTGTSSSLGGGGMFRVDGSKFYCRPADGYLGTGTHILTFYW